MGREGGVEARKGQEWWQQFCQYPIHLPGSAQTCSTKIAGIGLCRPVVAAEVYPTARKQLSPYLEESSWTVPPRYSMCSGGAAASAWRWERWGDSLGRLDCEKIGSPFGFLKS